MTDATVQLRLWDQTMANATRRPDTESVFVCVNCRQLAISTRRHAIFCCSACRVAGSRNGSAERLRRIADSYKVTAADICQSHALKLLRPDLFQRVAVGAVELEDCQPAMHAAFMKLLVDLVRSGDQPQQALEDCRA